LTSYRLYAFALVIALLALIAWPFDRRVSDGLRFFLNTQEGSPLWHLALMIKVFGKGGVLFLLAWVLAINRWKQTAVVACLAMLLVSPIVGAGKLIFERERPNRANTWSFPSGDAAAVTAFLVPIATAMPATKPIAMAGIAAVGMERVILGKHFPSDVLAGIAIGVFTSAVVLSLKISLKPRIRRFLRRSWLAAGLGLLVPIGPLLGGGKDLKNFLVVFGPAVALIVMAPFVRSWMRTLGRGHMRLSKVREETLALGLAAIIFAGFLFTTTRSTLWGQDETRFSEATVEMIHSGNYLVPTFNGDLQPDKPVLICWLMSLPVRIFGPIELACRFFAPLAAALVCFLTYRLGLNLFGPGTGLFALVILAMTPLFFIIGTAATADAVLLATIVAAFFIFEAALRGGPKKVNALGLGVVLGAALLTKGPVGLVIPLLSILAVLLVGRRLSGAWIRYLFISTLLAVGIFLAWGIPANEATGGELLRWGIGSHVLDRMSQPFERHGGNFYFFLRYYIPVIFLTFFPWILYLPASLSAVWGGRVGGENTRIFLLSWMIPTFLLMSFISTKLPHNILLIWPALALAVAATVRAEKQGTLNAQDLSWLHRGRWFFGVIGFFIAIVLMVGPWFVPLMGLNLPGFNAGGDDLIQYMVSLGLIPLVMTVLALKEHAAGRHRSAVGILVAGVTCLVFTLSVLALPAVERFKVAKPLGEAIRSKTGPDVPAAVFKYDEASLIFYIGRQRLKSLQTDEDVIAWAKESQPGVLVIPREALGWIEARSGSLGLEGIGAARGFNYGRGRWMDVVALGRRLR
jgi:membrane-associated phospholipid phosphatase